MSARGYLTGLLVAAAAVVGVITAAPAQAAPTIDLPGCGAEAPVPSSPYNGLSGSIIGVPDTIPAPADPFADNATTTIFEQYGLAGAAWTSYDTGCVNGLTDKSNDAGNGVANATAMLGQIPLGLTASLGNATLNPTWLHVLDRPITDITWTLRDQVTTPYGPLVFLLAAIMIVFAIRRTNLSGALTTLAFGLLGVALVALSTGLPLTTAHTMDRAALSLSTAGASAVQPGGESLSGETDQPGSRLLASMYTVVVYDRWVAGTLGSATSETARKYGSELWKAHALTWSEAQVVQDDPSGAGKDLIDAKRDRWNDIASEIEDEDPSAYEYLKGGGGEVFSGRMGEGATAMLFAAATMPFILGALVMVLMTYLIIRFLLILLPITALLLVLPKFHGLAASMAKVVAASLLNSLVFVVGGSIVIAIGSALIRSDTNRIFALAVTAVISIIAWVALAPFRQVTRLVSDPGAGISGLSAMGDNAKKTAGRLATSALGSFVGNLAADRVDEEHNDDVPDREPKNRPEVEYTDFDNDVMPEQAPRPRFDLDMKPAPAQAVPVDPREGAEYTVVPPATSTPATLPLPESRGLPVAAEQIPTESVYQPGTGTILTEHHDDDGSVHWAADDADTTFDFEGYTPATSVDGQDVFVLYDPDEGKDTLEPVDYGPDRSEDA